MRTRQIIVITGFVVGMSQVTHADCPLLSSHDKIDANDFGEPSGLDDFDFFGNGVTTLCDLNGDGIDEVAVGAIGDDDGGDDARGAVWILSLAEGSVQVVRKISQSYGLPDSSLSPGDQFGSSVASLGDINENGYCDLAVGAQFDDDGGAGESNTGAIWIVFLGQDAVVDSVEKISAHDGIGGLQNGDCLGGAVAGQDLDGDGRRDLIAGAGGHGPGDSQPGAIWTFLLNEDGTFHSHEMIADGDAPGLDLQDQDHFGVSLAGLEHLDRADTTVSALAVGAQGTDSARGAVWILTVNDQGAATACQKITQGSGGFADTLDTSDEFGRSVGALGDLEGDGIPELGVAATGDDDAGSDFGAVYVLSLAENGTVVAQRKIASTFGSDLGSGDNFGVAMGLLDDLDGDGRAEVACGANEDDIPGVNRGAVYVLSLNPTLPTTVDSVDDAIHFEFEVVNLHASSIDGLGFVNPRFIDQDSVADTSIVFLRASIFDASPISLPAAPPDRWVRLNQDAEDPQFQKETWWFFPAVSSSQTLPALGLTISDPGEGCTSESALLVDYSLTSGAATVRCGTIRLPCDIPVLTASPEYRPSDAGQPSSMRNYPNPFGPSTTIEYQLEAAGVATIEIYDVTGRLVRRLECGAQQPGAGRVQWDGTNADRTPAADGVYFYKLITERGESSRAKRLVLLRGE